MNPWSREGFFAASDMHDVRSVSVISLGGFCSHSGTLTTLGSDGSSAEVPVRPGALPLSSELSVPSSAAVARAAPLVLAAVEQSLSHPTPTNQITLLDYELWCIRAHPFCAASCTGYSMIKQPRTNQPTKKRTNVYRVIYEQTVTNQPTNERRTSGEMSSPSRSRR